MNVYRAYHNIDQCICTHKHTQTPCVVVVCISKFHLMEFDWQVSKIQENRRTSYDQNNTTGLSCTVAMWLTPVNSNYNNYINFISNFGDSSLH